MGLEPTTTWTTTMVPPPWRPHSSMDPAHPARIVTAYLARRAKRVLASRLPVCDPAHKGEGPPACERGALPWGRSTVELEGRTAETYDCS